MPLGTDDPIVAARAVRRALSDAGRRASDVEAVVVAAADPISPETLRHFARRALGPHGASVRIAGLTAPPSDAMALAHQAASEVAAGLGPSGIGVAVGLGPDGSVEARCVG